MELVIEEKQIMLTAPAKINLGLALTGRRGDGYHGIRTVMTSLDFGDRVVVSFGEESGDDPFFSPISLVCPGSDLPCDERNLAYRAAQLMVDRFWLKEPIEIVILKQIPVAAGLAGGSADAAAVLTGLNTLCKLGLSDEELCEIGLELGADVPYCIRRGTMLAEGIGEILTPLPSLAGIPVLLVNPGIEVSTKWAYETWDSLERPFRPSIDALVTFIRNAEQCAEPAGTIKITPETVRKLVTRIGNTFEPIATEKFPQIQEIKDQLMEFGACGTLMSGSGPTVFGLFDYEDRMLKAAAAMNDSGGDEIFVQATHMI